MKPVRVSQWLGVQSVFDPSLGQFFHNEHLAAHNGPKRKRERPENQPPSKSDFFDNRFACDSPLKFSNKEKKFLFLYFSIFFSI